MRPSFLLAPCFVKDLQTAFGVLHKNTIIFCTIMSCPIVILLYKNLKMCYHTPVIQIH